MGIQSKNRKEWALTHLANMYQDTTTVALYDTLGPDALKFVCGQTELTTIACSGECVEKLAKLKIGEDEQPEDYEKKMHRVQNLIIYDKLTDINKGKDTKIEDLCAKAGLLLHHIDDVVAAGKKH